MPHACVGDLNVSELAIPPSFFAEMPDDEWNKLLKDYGRLTEAQVERLYRMMRVPEARMPNVKLIKVVLPKSQLAKMEVYRNQVGTVPTSKPRRGPVKRMTVH